MIQLTFTPPPAKEYVDLRIRAGMGNKDLARSAIALQNSLFTVCLYDGDLLVAFGRIVGDGGITYVVSDIMVDAAYRRRGYAEQVMQQIDLYFEQHTYEDSIICLIANQPAGQLYHNTNLTICPLTKPGCCEGRPHRLPPQKRRPHEPRYFIGDSV